MREERSLHANVSGVGHHVLFAGFLLCIVFTYHPWLLFAFSFGRLWEACCIQVDLCSDQLFIPVSDSRLPRGIRPSVRHVVLHPGHYFRLCIRSDPSVDCTGSDPAVTSDTHW